MKKSLKEIAADLRVRTGYTIAFILLVVSFIVTLYSNNQLMKQVEWVKQTNKVIRNLEELVSGIKDAETGLRGYVNTKDSSFLQPYKTSFALVNSAFAALNADLENDDILRRSLVTLSSLVKERYDLLNFGADYFPKNNFVITDTLLQSFYWGKAAMDRIRATSAEMRGFEQRNLDIRTKDLHAKYRALNVIIITSLVLALIFAIFGFYTYRREYKARVRAFKRIGDYQAELQHRIEELDKANKELVLMRLSEKFAATGRMARTIAHEVRNPLTNIDLAVAQIKSEVSVAEDMAVLFDMVKRNSDRINQLISELLNATRFSDLNFTPVDINTLLDETLEQAKDRIELKHIRTVKEYGTGIPAMPLDQHKIQIAFLNVIVNAIEAMEPDKGILRLRTRKEGNNCVVEIIDNGCGMTAEEMDKLFEPYFTTKREGNGLGLTNMQNIILNHKGTLHVESEVGKGTRFEIKFGLQ